MNMILQLTSGQKSLYDLLYKEMSKGSYSIKLPLSFPKNSVNLFVKLVLGDHPDLINFDNCCVYFGSLGLFNILRLQPVFNQREIRMAQQRFDEETNRILKNIIKPGANSIQKVLAIHDYLVNNVVYDEDELYRRKSSVITHTAYGAIVEKKAVCEGIAYAFSLLAKKVGINTTVVNGIADGGEHAWNMIQIGTEYYHIDATWDIKNRPDTTVKAYDYFCLSDADLKMRNWDRKIYPQCSSSRYNYFNVTKSFAHDRQQLRDILLRQYTKYRSLYLKYDFLYMNKDDTVDYIWNELLDVARKNGFGVGNVTVSLNEEQGIFILYSK